MPIRSIIAGAMIAAALLLTSTHALAHHGWSGNTAGEIAVSGTLVTAVSLAGAHGTMQIRDAEGRLWNITLAPGPRTHRAGLREDTLPIGAEVTVHGERNADPDVYEMKVRRVLWDDREYEVYPPR